MSSKGRRRRNKRVRFLENVLAPACEGMAASAKDGKIKKLMQKRAKAIRHEARSLKAG